MSYKRLLDLTKFTSSAFIFGPRMTGKTFLLGQLGATKYFDLLDPNVELRFRLNPETFYQEIVTLPAHSTIVVDEIQKVPSLLDYVQIGIEKHQLRFILSGSSARKLKRGSANLLGGRALDLRLYPLTHIELAGDFDINQALGYGTLPKIYTLVKSGNELEARLLLNSYYTTYIKEDVQAEALVRNLAGFQRFLPVAASCDAREIAFSNVSEDAQVPASTVKDFFSILEDTLLGRFLWPWNASERKKSHPKFYMFDPGITRMLLNRMVDPPTGRELGLLFESWFVNEVQRLKDYYFKTDSLSFWKDGGHEVDLLIHNGYDFRLAIEIKSGEIGPRSLDGLNAFSKRHPNVPLYVASLKDSSKRILDGGIIVLPWKDALTLTTDTMR